MARGRRLALWIGWLGVMWLLVVFLASIVAYTRGIDTVAVLIALLAQLTVVIGWSLIRPLPLWIVFFHGLIMLSLVVGFVITAGAGGFVWMFVGLVPVGVAMLAAGLLHVDRSTALTH
jgi:hypothetical protein